MRRPAYEAKISAMRAEVLKHLDLEHDARHRDEMMIAEMIGATRKTLERVLLFNAVLAVGTVAGFIYLAVSQ
jgi:hypothetical protein